ncbi:glycosyltransferase family 1 protein [Chryseobacterium sp. G0162]|uniref:glycosyltransferase family 4 protein n=1 Tax=Chryseobacterium sp. G0162 TaxID=2487063 RepID=UPI000F508745|nr:glycosyltransferase [Chryseobacterium sp. G0162]AZB10282.1 glycosyltransferase family 1 protein [Chryseobacterium sp. G0162]
MGKKKFHCIFPIGQNVHLVKDVGMIPYMLQKEGYYESYISFYEKPENLPYLKNEVKGLHYKPIKKVFKNEDLNIFLFLLCHFWSMNYIMMFHPSFKKILISFLFKILSFNRLKFYFKMDANDAFLNEKFYPKSINYKIRNFLYNKTGKFTVETNKVANFINEFSYINVSFLPNGFIKSSKNNTPKENRLLWVGRVSGEEKGIKYFLSALSNIDLKNWKVDIVGPYDSSFSETIDNFFLNAPGLKGKIEFTGNISSRELLDEYYAKSKIFVLTSKYESFGLVLVEALAHGNFLVSSDLLPAQEISSFGKFGELFPIGDSQKLSSILQDIIDEKMHLPSAESIMEYAEQNYDWRVLVKRLYELLESK